MEFDKITVFFSLNILFFNQLISSVAIKRNLSFNSKPNCYYNTTQVANSTLFYAEFNHKTAIFHTTKTEENYSEYERDPPCLIFSFY